MPINYRFFTEAKILLKKELKSKLSSMAINHSQIATAESNEISSKINQQAQI
jgi:hypothetical protein